MLAIPRAKKITWCAARIARTFRRIQQNVLPQEIEPLPSLCLRVHPPLPRVGHYPDNDLGVDCCPLGQSPAFTQAGHSPGPPRSGLPVGVECQSGVALGEERVRIFCVRSIPPRVVMQDAYRARPSWRTFRTFETVNLVGNADAPAILGRGVS